MTSARNENTQFEDEETGELINNGYIYIGDQNLDPVLNPKTIYPDRALAGTPLANPQRTGADGRAENKLWIDGKYSLKVTDSGGTQKLIDLDRGDDTQVGNSLLINSLGINDVTVTGSPTIQTLVDNQTYVFAAPAANTGAMTLAIDSIAAKDIRKAHDQPMGSGDVKADQKLVVVYNETGDWFEMQSAVEGSVFGSSITVGGDILDSNGNEIIELTATSSAVNHLDSSNAATGSGPTLSAKGDDANIDLNLEPKGTGVVSAGGVAINPTVLSGHTRAGNTQINTGGTSEADFIVDTEVAEDAWESVGPTGSGADNIWTALDNLPTNATILKVNVYMIVSPSGASSASAALYAIDGDTTNAITTNNLIGNIITDSDVDITGNSGGLAPAEIPLNASHVFKIYYALSVTDASLIQLFYKGFITD